MRKKDLLYALTLTLMLGACGTKNNKEQTQNDTLDTVCVLGVTPSILIKKFDYVNKKGEVFRCSMKTVVGRRRSICPVRPFGYFYTRRTFSAKNTSSVASRHLIQSPSNPVCVSLAGSLLQTGSLGDTASPKLSAG